MAFSVEYSTETVSILQSLDPATAKRVLSKINQASEDPVHFFVRLKGDKTSKLRAGDFRIIALIDYPRRSIFIITIGHRKNVYD